MPVTAKNTRKNGCHLETVGKLKNPYIYMLLCHCTKDSKLIQNFLTFDKIVR